MNKLATLLAASLVLGSAFASTSPTPKKAVQAGKTWIINVGIIKPTGDHEDAGVNIGFMASADYHFGVMGDGTSNTSWFAGLGLLFGNGDADLTSTSIGVHVGVLFGLGQPGDDNPWAIELKGGMYRVNLKNGIDESETGFGGALGVVYKSQSAGGNGVRFGAGFYMMPEVVGADHRGFYFSVGFPVGGA